MSQHLTMSPAKPCADQSGRSRILSHATKERPRRRFLRLGFPAFTSPARVHLPGGAAERTKFQLPPVARDLSRVSGAVP